MSAHFQAVFGLLLLSYYTVLVNITLDGSSDSLMSRNVNFKDLIKLSVLLVLLQIIIIIYTTNNIYIL